MFLCLGPLASRTCHPKLKPSPIFKPSPPALDPHTTFFYKNWALAESSSLKIEPMDQNHNEQPKSTKTSAAVQGTLGAAFAKAIDKIAEVKILLIP
ncbi:hypothetical protein VNO77_04768 [Canavalia gladiata]|uniref:Uncharacterized protein n=1 Tax=Canavalia gladiata TaxID=3824 RepID=A0AAN9N2S8_CANGL